MSWRVGRRVPINVYDDDRPVCQCQTAMDAKLIVNAINASIAPDGEVAEAMSTSGETWEEQLDRVMMMVEGDPKWDLSDNDRQALDAILYRLKQCQHDTIRLDALFASRSYRSPLIRFANRLQVDAAIKAGNPDK